jgi:diguanylate cyclase
MMGVLAASIFSGAICFLAGAVVCVGWYRPRLAAAVRLSRTDELTGLGNRRALLDGLRSALRGGGSSLSLVLLDLDDFKAVNDGYGHGAGDQVLRVVGGRLGEALGGGCLVARLGGDEFAVVVGEDDPARLLGLARGVRAAAGRPVRVGPVDLIVRVSVGVTVRSPGDQAPADLLRRADLALYRAKAGAGAVVLAGPHEAGAWASVR